MSGGHPPALDSINSAVRSILKELITAGRRRRSKSVPTLCQAYSSLKACPIQFTSLQQLLSLDGFGQALVDRLQVLLCDWCTVNGWQYVESQGAKWTPPVQVGESEESDSDMEAPAPPKGPKPKRKAGAAERRPRVASAKSVAKAFVPQHRTGTHGILVALYTLTPSQPEAVETESGGYYYSKAATIHFAQPFSDAKYVPKMSASSGSTFGASFHSAWSGMKTLINRGYVYRRGNPACFGLSQNGWHVAQTCASREDGLQAGCNVDRLGSVAAGIELKLRQEAGSGGRRAADKTSVSKEPMASTPFLYAFLTNTDPPTQTTERSQARVRLSDDDFRMVYWIAFSRQLQLHAFAKSCVRSATPCTDDHDLLFGWVQEAACNETAPGIAEKQTDRVGNHGTAGSARKDSCARTTSAQLRAPLKPVAEKQNERSKAHIIELLTSSDMDTDEAVHSYAAKRKPSSDSESELSDLLPAKGKTSKTGKHRLASSSKERGGQKISQ